MKVGTEHQEVGGHGYISLVLVFTLKVSFPPLKSISATVSSSAVYSSNKFALVSSLNSSLPNRGSFLMTGRMYDHLLSGTIFGQSCRRSRKAFRAEFTFLCQAEQPLLLNTPSSLLLIISIQLSSKHQKQHLTAASKPERCQHCFLGPIRLQHSCTLPFTKGQSHGARLYGKRLSTKVIPVHSSGLHLQL